MVLRVQEFKLSASMRKLIRSLLRQQRLVIRMDHAFNDVIQACSKAARAGQNGTWITEKMIAAYQQFHQQGHVHSVETWLDGQLVGGLYAVNIGRMVYGESMFQQANNASKIALCALVSFCTATHMPAIDCQQETRHLASMGARPISRDAFGLTVHQLTQQTPPNWQFHPDHWALLLT